MGKLRKERAKHPKKYCPLDWVKCIDYNIKGQCIVKWNQKTYFVDEMIQDEEAKILIYYENDEFGDARAIQIKKPSIKRSLELGHPKMQLGSYHLAHFKDIYQDEFKQKNVEKIFNQEVLPIKVGSRTFYRNKVVLHDGGFMPSGRNRKHAVIPKENVFDLMKINFDNYKDVKGDWIIRELDSKIEGRPGENKSTTHTIMGKTFNVNLNSFYQVNTEMMEKAYLEIISFIPKNSVVFDLFSGSATIGIHASDIAKEVYCVEINKSSHRDALKNIELNNVKNVFAINNDVDEWIKNSKIKSDVIIINPARSGLAVDSTKKINNSETKRIIYLSCNIETQIIDINNLTNYKIIHIQPYDFFPQTYHIENLVILDKKNK